MGRWGREGVAVGYTRDADGGKSHKKLTSVKTVM